MQHRNYILFLVLSMGILIGWETFVLPRIAPRNAPAKKVVQNAEQAQSAQGRRRKAQGCR